MGRVRLELLLSKLQSEKGALRDENFDALRQPLNEAAKLDVVSAMEILGDSLRKRDPKAPLPGSARPPPVGGERDMPEVGLRYSNGAGVERDFVKAARGSNRLGRPARERGHLARGVLSSSAKA